MFQLKLCPSTKRQHNVKSCFFSYTNLTESLKISFKISGDLKNVTLPLVVEEDRGEATFLSFEDKNRAIGLWKNTCFEFFLGHVDKKNYFEFNFNGLDKWNLFTLTHYRSPIKEYFFTENISYKSSRTYNSFELEIDIPKIIVANNSIATQKILFNAAIIIQDKEHKGPQYWSLHDTTLAVDFHQQNLWQKLKSAKC